MNAISVRVIGTPAPGGSKNAFVPKRKDGSFVMRPGGSLMVNVTDAGGKANKEWKKAVAIQARAFMRSSPPHEGPIEVELAHCIKRPKNHFRTGKFSGVLSESAPRYHTQKPDALKFARATEDALTGIIWVDDCQNVKLTTVKRWCYPGEQPGCIVSITYL